MPISCSGTQPQLPVRLDLPHLACKLIEQSTLGHFHRNGGLPTDHLANQVYWVKYVARLGSGGDLKLLWDEQKFLDGRGKSAVEDEFLPKTVDSGRDNRT